MVVNTNKSTCMTWTCQQASENRQPYLTPQEQAALSHTEPHGCIYPALGATAACNAQSKDRGLRLQHGWVVGYCRLTSAFVGPHLATLSLMRGESSGPQGTSASSSNTSRPLFTRPTTCSRRIGMAHQAISTARMASVCL